MNEQESADFLDVNRNEWVTIFRALGIEETAHYNLNPPGAERILCVCRGGNCRSVATAFLLKYKYKRDALSISLEKNSYSIFLTLCRWADRVVVSEKEHLQECRTKITLIEDAKKLTFVDLGGMSRLLSNPFNLDFLKFVDSKLQEAGFAAKQ